MKYGDDPQCSLKTSSISLSPLRGAGVCRFVAVHQIAYPANVDIDRALANTAAAADAHDARIVFVYEILKLVHEALAHPLGLGIPRIMAGGVDREDGKHAAVPLAQAFALLVEDLILDVETPAGRAKVSTGPAIDAREGHVIPKGGIKEVVDGP